VRLRNNRYQQALDYIHSSVHIAGTNGNKGSRLAVVKGWHIV